MARKKRKPTPFDNILETVRSDGIFVGNFSLFGDDLPRSSGKVARLRGLENIGYQVFIDGKKRKFAIRK